MQLDKGKHQQQVEKFIKRMPSLSTTVGKVLEVCSRTDASPNELNKVVSLDPVLTGQVLKLINSAYYSLVTRVTSLPRAITMLGMNTVKNMALSTAVIKTVGSAQKSKVLPTAKFWAHTIGVGACAKLLAVSAEVPATQREEYFVAGLLHDLGKIPYGDEYSTVLSIAEKEQVPLLDVERELLGLDHQQVGLMIGEKWKLNQNFKECIAKHHDIDLVDEEFKKQTACIALADIYVNIFDIGYAGNRFPSVEHIDQLLDTAGLSWKQYGAVREGVEKEIERAQIFLQI